MKNAMLATVALVAALNGPSMAWAQHDHGSSMPMPSIPQVRTGKVTGKVVDFTDNSITVETNKKGQTLKATYLIDGRTKAKGTPAVGQEVTVKYREERGAQVATNIEVKKAKRPGA
jgi:RNase P/RNase MRP subunit p29